MADGSTTADSLLRGRGYIGRQRAEEVATEVPEARTQILDWLRDLADAGDWRPFERLAAVAVHLHPDGLGAVLASVLADRPPGVNVEDLVDMLGELGAAEGVEPISSLVRDKKDTDGPFYGFCTKGIQALAEIGGSESERFLQDLAGSGDWPEPLRRCAAEELGMEEELGFGEML